MGGMSNCEVVELPLLEVGLEDVKGALRAVLHTVLFARALGVVRPVDVELPRLGLAYAECGDPGVSRRVEEKIGQFLQWAERHPGKVAQVSLAFFEKRYKQSWFSSQEERLFWERWNVNVRLAGAPAPGATGSASGGGGGGGGGSWGGGAPAEARGSLGEVLDRVARVVNERKDHIPPVMNSEVVTFPFDISVTGADGSKFGLGQLKKFLVETAPPRMLN